MITVGCISKHFAIVFGIDKKIYNLWRWVTWRTVRVTEFRKQITPEVTRRGLALIAEPNGRSGG